MYDLQYQRVGEMKHVDTFKSGDMDHLREQHASSAAVTSSNLVYVKRYHAEKLYGASTLIIEVFSLRMIWYGQAKS